MTCAICAELSKLGLADDNLDPVQYHITVANWLLSKRDELKRIIESNGFTQEDLCLLKHCAAHVLTAQWIALEAREALQNMKHQNKSDRNRKNLNNCC